jgi:parallel beta-helix repeat protein
MVGTDPAGNTAIPNNQAGVSIDGAPNTAVGGTTTSARNVISFNGTNGVQIFHPGADGNKILGNTIAQNNVGISETSGTGNTLGQNSISGHTGLGIDLAPTGVNLNQSGGPNNYPVLTSARPANGTTTILGTLNNATAAAYTIEFFSSPSCNQAGYGEGATFLGSTNVGTDASGNASVNFAAVVPATGNVITTTATDAAGSTSEFSACRFVSGESSGLLYDNFNTAVVTQSSAGPPNPTTFVLTAPVTITQVVTYHWNNATGATPGTIGLQQLNGPLFGPYAAVGQLGQNNVANAAWAASPNVTLPPGTYTVVDSDPTTWSFNTGVGGSGGEGFVRVWGF